MLPFARFVGDGHLGGVFSRSAFDFAFNISTPAIVSLRIGFHVVVRLLFISVFGSKFNVSCRELDNSDKISRRFIWLRAIYRIDSMVYIIQTIFPGLQDNGRKIANDSLAMNHKIQVVPQTFLWESGSTSSGFMSNRQFIFCYLQLVHRTFNVGNGIVVFCQHQARSKNNF